MLSSLTAGTDHGQEAIESAAMFLFKTFYDKETVGHKETKAIKQMFGPFPSTCATAACNATYRIVSLLTDEQLKKLSQHFHEKNIDDAVFFGKNVIFSLEMYELEETEDLPLNGSVEADNDISLDFLKFHNGQKDISAISTHQKHGSNEDEGSLLYDEVEKYVVQSSTGGATVEDLCNTIFEMLASSKSNDELQNEVCPFWLFFYLFIFCIVFS